MRSELAEMRTLKFDAFSRRHSASTLFKSARGTWRSTSLSADQQKLRAHCQPVWARHHNPTIPSMPLTIYHDRIAFAYGAIGG